MKKKHLKVLEDIQDRANAKFGDKLWKTKPKADVMLEVIDKALNEERDQLTPEQIDKLETIKDSHMLEGMEKVIDEKVAKKMDKYISDEVEKAIKFDMLPPRDQDPIIKKLKQKNARRTKKSEKGSNRSTEGSCR